MLAILLAVGSAMPKNMVSSTNDSTIVTSVDGDGTHVPPTIPPPPAPLP